MRVQDALRGCVARVQIIPALLSEQARVGRVGCTARWTMSDTCDSTCLCSTMSLYGVFVCVCV